MADENGQEEAIDRKVAYREKYKGVTDIAQLAREMARVQREKEAAENVLKEWNAEFDVLRLEVIPTACEDQGVEGMRVEGVGRLGLTADLYVSTKAGGKDDLFKWFRKNKLSDLIQEGVNSSTLKAWVKDRIKKGKPVPQELLNVTPFTRASITKG